MAVNRRTLDLVDELRRRLQLAVTGVTSRIDSEWARAWEVLAGEWTAAMEDAVIRSSLHLPGATGRLDDEQRVRDALTQTSHRLDQLAATSRATATAAAAGIAADAVTYGRRIALSQLPPNRAVPWRDPDARALDTAVHRTGQQITALHYPISDDATARIKAELIRGTAVGENPRRAAQRMVGRVEAEFNGGRNRALVIARTELLDVHRDVSRQVRLENRDVVAGWEWQATLDPRTCGGCLGMHGTRHPASEQGPNGHQQCRCVAVPVTKSWRDLGFDVPEPPSLSPDADTWFRSQPASVQDRIVGPKVSAALLSGRLTMSDLATRRSTPGWRDSIHATPTKTLLRKAGSS